MIQVPDLVLFGSVLVSLCNPERLAGVDRYSEIRRRCATLSISILQYCEGEMPLDVVAAAASQLIDVLFSCFGEDLPSPFDTVVGSVERAIAQYWEAESELAIA